jgi:hypothetical protein
MPLTAPPTAPSTADPSTFSTRMDATLAWLATNVTEMNAFQAALTALAAGGAMAIPYTFSTTTTDADPGAGYLRLDNATQNLATTIRADLAGSDGSAWTDVLNTFDGSTSTIKGYIRLAKATDSTKWIIASVSALASPSGYKNIAVAVIASSAASPFTNGDALIMYFSRTGDAGTGGAAGADGANGADGSPKFLSAVTASNSATVDIETTFDSTYDAYMIVGAGVVPANDGVALLVRMKLGGSYQTTGYDYHMTNLNPNSSAYAASTNAGHTGIIVTGALGNDVAESAHVVVKVFNPTNTTKRKMILNEAVGTDGSGIAKTHYGSGACTASTGALTGIRLYFETGNISSGTFRLYGIKNS